jgi:NAD-dependent deacetylase
MESNQKIQLEKAAQLIRGSKHAVFLTGAGISTASGIPDFRSPRYGLWENNDPYEVASLTAFQNNPEKFYNWITPLYKQSKAAQPNEAHISISKLEKQGLVKTILTQNIDGLHQKSGSKNVIELHGSARTATCLTCQKKYIAEELFDIMKKCLPACIDCGHIIKPDVVLYEEMLPEKEWILAYKETIESDVFFVAGSSLEVYPVNALPRVAVQNGSHLIINTLSDTPFDHIADLLIRMDVTLSLPEIVKLIKA